MARKKVIEETPEWMKAGEKMAKANAIRKVKRVGEHIRELLRKYPME